MTSADEQMGRSLETALRIGGLFLMIYLVARITAPFVPLLVWGVIIAVAARPVHRRLSARCNGRSGLAATLLTLLVLLMLIVPAAWLGSALVEWGTGVAERLKDGSLHVPPPPETVSTWPLIGERVHAAWALASTNLSEAVREVGPQVRAVAEWLLATVAGTGLGVVQFALSIVVAGVLLTHAERGAAFVRQLFSRLIPGAAIDYADLSEKVIRSVATGVIGVAFIQAALIGVGLVAIGVPGAPIFIAATVLLGIVQLPATLITLPVLIWVWGSHPTLPAVLFTLWILPAGLADNVLKPLLLGRGVEAPMLVVFVGAIGGFMYSGIVGLFMGAVVLALAHGLFQAWLNQAGPPPDRSAEPTAG